MQLSPQGTCPSYYYGNRLIQSRHWFFTPKPSLAGKLVDTFARCVPRTVSPSKVLRKFGISGNFQPRPSTFVLEQARGEASPTSAEQRGYTSEAQRLQASHEYGSFAVLHFAEPLAFAPTGARPFLARSHPDPVNGVGILARILTLGCLLKGSFF